MIIYIITNKINGKQYIGQTKSRLKKRFNQHCEKRNKTTISNAIKKYGKDNFSIEILKENIKTQSELNHFEKLFIIKFNTISPHGYNIESGGSSPMTEETKQKIKIKLKNRKVTWGDKVGESVKKLWENEDYRKKQTEQRFNKRGNYKKGIVREKLKKKFNIMEFEKDYSNFSSLADISKKYNISVPTIYKTIKKYNIKKRGYKCNQKKV